MAKFVAAVLVGFLACGILACAPVGAGAPPTADAITEPISSCLGTGQTELPTSHFQEVEYPPEVVIEQPPVYPEAARAAGVEGTVVLYALVCANAAIRETRIVHSIPQLDAAAIEAVRRWTFRPATQGGNPVAAWVEARVVFDLP